MEPTNRFAGKRPGPSSIGQGNLQKLVDKMPSFASTDALVAKLGIHLDLSKEFDPDEEIGFIFLDTAAYFRGPTIDPGEALLEAALRLPTGNEKRSPSKELEEFFGEEVQRVSVGSLQGTDIELKLDQNGVARVDEPGCGEEHRDWLTVHRVEGSSEVWNHRGKGVKLGMYSVPVFTWTMSKLGMDVPMIQLWQNYLEGLIYAYKQMRNESGQLAHKSYRITVLVGKEGHWPAKGANGWHQDGGHDDTFDSIVSVSFGKVKYQERESEVEGYPYYTPWIGTKLLLRGNQNSTKVNSAEARAAGEYIQAREMETLWFRGNLDHAGQGYGSNYWEGNQWRAHLHITFCKSNKSCF